MNGICPVCGGNFPLVKGFSGDRITLAIRVHNDERGYCSGSGKEPRDWPVDPPYEPTRNDSGSISGLSSWDD